MAEEKVTFCRICEPMCGMIATVENDKLVALRPDPEHPLTKGYACPKGMGYLGVQNDPDRILHPLKRQPDGTFERVSWDSAMADIIVRLRTVRQVYGDAGVGIYFGNPAALNFSQNVGMQLLMRFLRTPHVFSAGSQDTNSRFVASHLLYGLLTSVPIPDLPSTDLLVILGANPNVSHASLISTPRIKDQLVEIEQRGGRVVVVDPRRTETAQEHEWLPIVPDSDAWFLLSLLQVILSEGLADEVTLDRQASGLASLKRQAADFPPEVSESRTGIPADQVRALARELVTRRAAIYGRTGTCLGSSSTLVNFLMDAVNLVSGNLDARGGSIFGQSPIPLNEIAHRTGVATVGTRRSRIGDLPEVLGTEPAIIMAEEITTPGPGQIRAMIVTAGNPVLSTPNGPALEEALETLDLMVCIDLYANETSAHADYILPSTAMYERDDFPVANLDFFAKPFMQATKAVVPPPGEARLEWDIYDEILKGLRASDPSLVGKLRGRLVNMASAPMTPTRMLDSLIRIGRGGDRFGLRPGGLNLKRLLKNHPHGIVFAEELEVGRLGKVVRHKDGKVHLSHPDIDAEIARLSRRAEDPAYPLFLVGMRELRSENSWMHNVGTLRTARPPHAARIHPGDAAELGLVHSGLVRLVSKTGEIELPVLVTEDISRGVVAVPHGWGHKGTGKWQRANQEGGVNVNILASSNPADVEPLAGMSHLSGIPIRAEVVVPAAPSSSQPATVGV